MKGAISMAIDPKTEREVLAALDTFPQQGRRAASRAINKTLAWVRTHGQRAIVEETDVPLKALRLRRRVAIRTSRTNSLAGVAWFGIRPIIASALGTPRQTRTGARVHRHTFEGAFVARMPSGHLGIFRRKGADRLPIMEETVDLSQAQAVVRRVFDEAPARFRTLFLQELNYELNVRGRR